MPRLLFSKMGEAVWISHLDLMRLFQRAFKRSDLPLTHTQGYNPRPSVSIAMPLSVGVESVCELLDFELEGEYCSGEEIVARLNGALVKDVEVLKCYPDGKKIKELAYLSATLTLEYDAGIPTNAEAEIRELFSREMILVEKKGKNGPQEQNIAPMIRALDLSVVDEQTLQIQALVCCQNPSLNPMLLASAIDRYMPDCKPDFVRCRREEIFDANNEIFR